MFIDHPSYRSSYPSTNRSIIDRHSHRSFDLSIVRFRFTPPSLLPSFGFSLLKGASPAPSPSSSFPHLLSIRAFSPSSSANTQGRMADLISPLLSSAANGKIKEVNERGRRAPSQRDRDSTKSEQICRLMSDPRGVVSYQ